MIIVGSPVTNTGIATATVNVVGSYSLVTIQAIFEKTSGTLAGDATLKGSLDGINYVTIPTPLIKTGSATYTVLDVALQSISFVLDGSPYLHYQISWAGVGTMVGTLDAIISLK